MHTVCSEIHTEHINALCGQNVEYFNLKQEGIKGLKTVTELSGSEFYFKCEQFKFQPGHWLSWLKMLAVFLGHCRQILREYLRFGRDNFKILYSFFWVIPQTLKSPKRKNITFSIWWKFETNFKIICISFTNYSTCWWYIVSKLLTVFVAKP
jgi:hypothetical protein